MMTGQLAIFPSKSVIGESAVGSSQEDTDDMCSLEAGSQQLVSKGIPKLPLLCLLRPHAPNRWFLPEKEQLEIRKASLRGQVDGEAEVKVEFSRKLADYHRKFDERVAELDAILAKMAKETDEEFAPMPRDDKKTKEFLFGKGFHYFLNKFQGE
ncbi:hypothetical protein Tco_0009494 [Tanacetum coccineum]